MVNQAKQVALNPRDNSAANKWRDVNEELLHAVRSVGDAITGELIFFEKKLYNRVFGFEWNWKLFYKIWG